MEDLAKADYTPKYHLNDTVSSSRADFRTIKTFITNNITAERLLVDILHQSVSE